MKIYIYLYKNDPRDLGFHIMVSELRYMNTKGAKGGYPYV